MMTLTQTDFKEIKVEAIKDNAFKLIASDWMLITAGSIGSYNTMTANWGGMGYLWNRNVCFCFVRPTRHTYGFMERSAGFTLSFFDEKYRDALNFCGSRSGRDVNKAAETGITPVGGDSGSVFFEEARMILECRKIYFQDINPANFIDSEINKNYPGKDYHRMYVGEIVKCLIM